MINSREEWNIKFKDLKNVLKKPGENLDKVKDLIIDLHKFTHESNIDGYISLEDHFWGLQGDYTKFTKSNLYSPLWEIWHSTRIEDICCARFILDKNEILFSDDFEKKINVPFRHTGNSMNFGEMEIFNQSMNIIELKKYRRTVAQRTESAIKNLTAQSIQEKVRKESLQKISASGSVAPADSWLLDYWGRKQIAGILTMPFTRHLLVHLNSAIRKL